ncbi:MAG TPA: hypothetical protein EYP61_02620 [Candidatus Latescibacteria bacterium]|nr:hypothetical protein [Candidatus Latescibacterota bacterium]
MVSVIMIFVCDVYAMWDRPGKKLVEYGWDVPSPAFVRRHIRKMERLPFDGIVLRLRDTTMLSIRRGGTRTGSADSSRNFTG